MTKRRLTAVLAIAFLAAVSGAVLYLHLVPIDLTSERERIESLIETRVNGEVVVESVVVKALPFPDISIKGFKAERNGETIFSARDLRLKLSLVSLITGRPVLKYLGLEGFELNVRRDKAGRTNLLDLLKIKERRIDIRSASIKGGVIRIKDEVPAGAASYEITGIEGYAYEYDGGSTYRIDGTLLPATKISVSGLDKDGVAKGTASIKGIEIERFNPYLDSEKGSSIEGRAGLKIAYVIGKKKSFNAALVYSELKAHLPAYLDRPVFSKSGSIAAEASFEDGLTDISAKDIDLDIEGISVKGRAGVFGPKDKRTFTASLSTSRLPVKSIKDFIPLKKLPENAARRIDEVAPLAGSITLNELSVSSPVEDLKSLALIKKPGAVLARASIDAAGFRHRALKEPFSGISGRAEFKDGVLTIAELSGRYGKEALKRLNARIRDISGSASYEVSLEGVFDAEETLDLAKKFIKEEEGGLFKAIRRAYGRGEIGLSFDAVGSLKGKAPLRYSGKIDLRNVSFSYEGFPLDAESINGDVAFDQRSVTVRRLTVSDGFSKLDLSGSIEDYASKAPAFDMKAKGDLQGATVAGLIKGRPVEDDLEVKGAALFDASARGTTEAFTVDAAIDAGAAHVEYGRFIRKEEDYPLSAEGSLSVENGELKIKKATLASGPSSIRISGSLLKDLSSYSISAEGERLDIRDLDDISPLLSPDFASGGFLTFKVNAEKTGQSAVPSMEGACQVRDAHFKSPYIASPVERINAVANFKGNRADIAIEEVSIGDTKVSGSIDILDIAERKVKFRLAAPRFYTKDIFRKREPAGAEEDGPEAGAAAELKKGPPVNGAGTIKIAEGELFRHAFKDFFADITLGKDSVRVSPLRLDIDGGSVSADLTYYRKDTEPLLFKTTVNLNGVNLETMISAFGAKKQVLSGDMQGRITLSGTRGIAPFARGLNGGAYLASERGRLWKFPVLTAVFSVVNILSIDELLKEGLPYKTLTGEFTVKDGVISSEKMALASDSMRMSAYGEIDLAERQIDGLLAIHPFVTIDKIISSIPLAGWIITGKEKKTLSMYFSIEGPLKKPDVDPVPTMSIKEGILGIIERIIEAPIEIIKPGE